MNLSSSAFDQNGLIPKQYACDGENISPPLLIKEAPAGVGSFALIVHDPDAPNGDFTHFLVWNIAPDVREMGEGIIPNGANFGMNGFGEVGWGGPCPPSGEHRYIFDLYALDGMIDLPMTATREDLEGAMEGHVLDQSKLTGRYSKA